MAEVQLGDLVRDRLSGFTGIAYGKNEWLNKCVRYSVHPRELKDGKPIEPQWFDVEQLEVVEPQALVFNKKHPTAVHAMQKAL